MATQLKDMKLSDFALKGDSGCDGATFVLCDGDRITDQCGGSIIYVSCENPWCASDWMFNGISRCAGSAYCANNAYYAVYADYADSAYCANYAGSANYADYAGCADSACYADHAGYAYELYVDGCSHCIQYITYDCLSSLPACARILYYT